MNISESNAKKGTSSGVTVYIKIGRYTYPATVVNIGDDGVIQVKAAIPEVIVSMIKPRV